MKIFKILPKPRQFSAKTRADYLENANDCRQKADHVAEHIRRAQTAPLFVQDRRGEDDKCGEKNVVDRRHHRRVVHVERLVQVHLQYSITVHTATVHALTHQLNRNTRDNRKEPEIGEHVRKLLIPRECLFDRKAKTLNSPLVFAT